MKNEIQYWLLKTEPETFSFADLEKEGISCWDGVRNYQARNNLKMMKKGDKTFIYHSVSDKAIVGIAEVVKEHYLDPSIDDERWVAIDVKALKKLLHPVSLSSIKDNPQLQNMPLVNYSRLSVQPVNREHYDIILEMAKGLSKTP